METRDRRVLWALVGIFVGIILVVVGAGAVYPPAAPIVAGLALVRVTTAFMAGMRRKAEAEEKRVAAEKALTTRKGQTGTCAIPRVGVNGPAPENRRPNPTPAPPPKENA